MYELNDKLRDLRPYDPIVAGDMIRLDANESFASLPDELLREAAQALESLDLNRYPDPAARALCAAFAARCGVAPEHVVAGNGSDELISVLFLAFLQKGEAFATLEPDFSMYGLNGFLNEAAHVAIPKGPGCRIDVDRVIETCRREKVRLLIFSNPCNPSSVVLPREEVRRLVREVEGLVILDEAYMDFSDQSLLPEHDEFDNLLILRTCSKAMGLAALRLGFAVGPQRLIDAVRAAKAPYNVNALSQAVGTLVLRRGEVLDRARKTILCSRDRLLSGLARLEEENPGRFTLLSCAANFAALDTPEAEKISRYLWQRKIAVRHTGGLLRITCGREEENRALLGALAQYFEEG